MSNWLRDVLWLILLAALSIAWWKDHRDQANEIESWKANVDASQPAKALTVQKGNAPEL